MCIKGNKGLKIKALKGLLNKFEYFFGEDQGRYIIEITKENVNKVTNTLTNNSIHFDDFGIVNEKSLTFEGDINLPIEELTYTHKYWLKEFMNK